MQLKRSHKGKTMLRHDASTFALMTAVALALGACNANDGRAPAAQPDGQIQGASVAPSLVDPAEQAPFVLELTGPAVLPAAGDVEVRATLTSARGFNAPATLAVVLPKGATLASGLAHESFAAIPAGTTTRTFRVTMNGATGEPIRVSIDARSADGAMGAHAARQVPPEAEPAYKRPSRGVPPPPVSRPIGHAPAR